MARKLKVFRTSIGFHDAYIAVPSKKAALEAWGSQNNLFATGAAEEVTDPAFSAAALATPGVVVKLPRGTTAEHLAALRKSKAKAHKNKANEPEQASPSPRPTLQPRPSRQKLDAAREALDQSKSEYDRKLADLELERRKLDQKQHQIENDRDAAIASLQQRLDEERAAYKEAIDQWQG